MPQYLISMRAIDRKTRRFIAEPGEALYLEVPDGQLPDPSHKLPTARWLTRVRDLADGQADGVMSDGGDILVFIHGYNNSPAEIMQRHRLLQLQLSAAGWRGIVLSFDWPCENQLLNYWEDRSDAVATAKVLIEDGLRLLGEVAGRECQTNIHLLGHSTGAFVIMKAFEKATDYRELYQSNWRIGQVAFIGGDVSAASLDADSAWSRNLFERIMRLTNYQNAYDMVLGVSNAKRLGAAPRAGRVGLNSRAHAKAINVDCSDYFRNLDPDKQQDKVGWWPHSWHIGNPVFALDLAMTLEGRYDRHYLPTRELVNGELRLKPGERPKFERKWLKRDR